VGAGGPHQHFAAEMEELRSKAQPAEERYRAAEKRAMLDMDGERAAAARLQKELEAGRGDATKAVGSIGRKAARCGSSWVMCASRRGCWMRSRRRPRPSNG
jgi:hypothetical protein